MSNAMHHVNLPALAPQVDAAIILARTGREDRLPETIDPLAPLVAAVAARVRATLGEVVTRPELVTQRTVAAVVGMPSRDFLRHCRAGSWLSYGDRRLRYARTADVVAYVEAHPVHADAVDMAGDDAEAIAFARVGARRVAPSTLASTSRD